MLSKDCKGVKNNFFGRHHTKESIEKNRQSHLGKVAWNKGKKLPFYPHIKAKGRIPWNKGRKTKVEIPRRGIIRGKDHWNYGSKSYNIKCGEFTSIEKKVYAFLEGNNVKFEKQKKINNKFKVDAFIPSINLILELDGNYWHSLDRVKKKDKGENAYLLQCGYNLLRLTESEIMDNSYERKLLKCF